MTFEVDTAQLSDTIQQLQSTLDSISGTRIKMYQAAEELESMWVGEAHDTFLVAYNEDNNRMVSLIGEIQSVIDNVTSARQSYESCEQSVKDLIRTIQI